MTEKDRLIAELYAKNTRLERESTERVQKSTALLRKRINELTEANISLRKENEYLFFVCFTCYVQIMDGMKLTDLTFEEQIKSHRCSICGRKAPGGVYKQGERKSEK